MPTSKKLKFLRKDYNALVVLFLALCTTGLIYGQERKEYKEYFLDGAYNLLDENYTKALSSFKDAYKIDSINANINFNIGFSIINTQGEKSRAAYYLKKSILDISENYIPFDPKEKSAPTNAYYYLGLAFRYNYQFDDAIRCFERFKTYIKPRETELMKEVDRQLAMCVNAKDIYSKPTEAKINILSDTVNGPYPDYSPVISADESTLIFTSRRAGGIGYELTPTGDFYEDIYICHKDNKGEWTTPESIGPNINTPGHEAAIALSANGEQLLIYKDDNGDGNIYLSKLTGETWSVPEKMGSDINSTFWEPSACFSPDGNILYFVSDRLGGSGGRDIYRCVKLPNGEWSLASNLGPAINTEYDEDAPFMHPDGVTLIFSSNGHKTSGGFDVFYTTKEENGTWSEIKNMGAPINTPDDDIFYVLSADGKRAYYSSAKTAGVGDKDIYLITLSNSIVDPITLLKGIVTFDGDLKEAKNVQISVIDDESGKIVQEIRPNSKTGKYIIALNGGPTGRAYTVRYESTDYKPITDKITIQAGGPYQEILKEVDLTTINFESKTPGTLSISGVVKNTKKETIPNVNVTVKNNQTGESVGAFFTDKNSGKYYFVLQTGKNYNIAYDATGYLFHSENINVPKQPEFKEIVKDVTLDPIVKGATIVLNNVFFDSNKSLLRKESDIELEKLYTFLKENGRIKVEVSGHTDSKGKDETNLKLSKDRAQSVVNYLIKRGIDKNRIIAKGYGETVPMAPNSTADGKPNLEGMQLNRRVELKIIE